jgi:hydroxymethylpyrimidine pyrophosphatase-like HAD family hydrolase
MTLDVLATDYDGTIASDASDGHVDAATLDALERARNAGIRLVLVTGRMLDSLSDRFEPLDLFERVVAENGAVVYDPARSSTTMLAQAPPAEFLEALARDGVPVSVGWTMVATGESHHRQLLKAIRDFRLAWHVISNRSAGTALPVEVTKATGLLRVLTDIGAAPDRTVGVGDAENDLAFLRVCGLAVAVSDASSCVQEAADVVTDGARGAGVAQLIDGWLTGELNAIYSNCRKPGRRRS